MPNYKIMDRYGVGKSTFEEYVSSFKGQPRVLEDIIADIDDIREEILRHGSQDNKLVEHPFFTQNQVIVARLHNNGDRRSVLTEKDFPAVVRTGVFRDDPLFACLLCAFDKNRSCTEGLRILEAMKMWAQAVFPDPVTGLGPA